MCHYRHGPCQVTGVLGLLAWQVRHGRATAGTGRGKVLAFWA